MSGNIKGSNYHWGEDDYLWWKGFRHKFFTKSGRHEGGRYIPCHLEMVLKELELIEGKDCIVERHEFNKRTLKIKGTDGKTRTAMCSDVFYLVKRKG